MAKKETGRKQWQMRIFMAFVIPRHCQPFADECDRIPVDETVLERLSSNPERQVTSLAEGPDGQSQLCCSLNSWPVTRRRVLDGAILWLEIISPSIALAWELSSVQIISRWTCRCCS
jgi:hypothetical protein